MDKTLFMIVCQLKLMNLLYHNAHNLTKGPNFVGDHSLFNDFYSVVEGDYDDVVERAIGMDLEHVADLSSQMSIVSKKIEALPSLENNEDRFGIGLSLEQELCKMIEKTCAEEQCSMGLEQLIGNIADKSEARQYKIKQRLK